MPCWRSIDFDQIKGTSGSKAMEGTNHFNFSLRMMHFRQSTNLRVSFELFQCGLKSQSEYKGDRLFAFCLQRAYDRTGSKSVWLWKRVHLQFKILLNSFKQLSYVKLSYDPHTFESNFNSKSFSLVDFFSQYRSRWRYPCRRVKLNLHYWSGHPLVSGQ